MKASRTSFIATNTGRATGVDMSAWEALTSQVSTAIREFKRVSTILAANLYAEEVQRQVAEASAAIEEAGKITRGNISLLTRLLQQLKERLKQ